MKAISHRVLLCCLLLVLLPRVARADGKSQLAKEAAEFMLQRFGKQAVQGGVAALTRRIEALALQHGSEVFQAVKRVGPRAFHLVEQAGVHGKDAVRLMAMHGEHGVAWVLTRPTGMALFLKHGDKAAAALVKHPGIAEPVIGKLGVNAVRALEATGPQAGRRLAMLVEGGDLVKIGRSQELLEVIAKYGDRAMTAIWQNKGALATAAGLSAFLINPEPFINGAKDVAQIVGENAVRPVMQIPGAMAAEVARGTNWTAIILAVGGGGLLLLAAKYFHFRNGLPLTLKVRNEDKDASTGVNGSSARDARAGDKFSKPR